MIVNIFARNVSISLIYSMEVIYHKKVASGAIAFDWMYPGMSSHAPTCPDLSGSFSVAIGALSNKK